MWGRIGWPDHLYLYHGRVLFIEFKRAGEKPRKIQEHIHERIRKHGFNVVVVDNHADGRAVIDRFTQDLPDI
jgi:adenylate kinase